MRTTVEMWTYRDGIVDPAASPLNVVGYGVEATDGSIGKVDDATYEVGSSFLVVDTGPWIFGKKVMLPAGTIQRIDENDEKVWVNRTKDQIKNAPEYDETNAGDKGRRHEIGTYYGAGGPGYRDWDDPM